MAIAARWRRLDALPPARGRDAMPGVYELADEHRRTIYVGQSARDVPNRLRQHLAAGGCVAAKAAFWRYRHSRVPQAEEAALLAALQAAPRPPSGVQPPDADRARCATPDSRALLERLTPGRLDRAGP